MRPCLVYPARKFLLISFLFAWPFCLSSPGQEAEKQVADRLSASRLRAIREIMSRIQLKSQTTQDWVPLDLKPDPILRYNDVTRGILDSVIFRVGTKGRPSALISAELYGRQGQVLLLNHEFVALLDPDFELKRDNFAWQPEKGNLVFQEMQEVEPPSENPRLRLAQMRQISERFAASQKVGASQIILRRMSAPLDRYQPSDLPRADGSIFAFAWGVNPEAALFVESDGKKWLYAWAPLSSAPLEAKLGEVVVWSLKTPPLHEDRTSPYTSIHRQFEVPEYFDKPVEEEERQGVKNP